MSLTPATLKFLRALKRNNDRDWFNKRKDIFVRDVQEPFHALIEEINAGLYKFAPEHVRPANKVMMRIYRDTRFSNDKTPYKTRISAWWGAPKSKHVSGPGFYLHVSGEELLLYAGSYMPLPEELKAIRSRIAEDAAPLRKVLQAAAIKKALPEEELGQLKRTPRGYASNHPAAELLRATRYGRASTLAVEEALNPKLAGETLKVFRAANPLVKMLVEMGSKPLRNHD